MARIIDGKKIAKSVQEDLRADILQLSGSGCQPSLSVVLVGEDPASQIYVKMKSRAASELGIESKTIRLPETVSEDELLGVVSQLNADVKVHGILVQLPMPAHIDETKVINSIAPDKDVDGFHPINRGKLLIGEDTLVPCTPLGVQELLIRENIRIEGKHVVIVGRSKIVGLPLATILVQKQKAANATVTVCHTGTPDPGVFTGQADILIAAAGKPEVIKGSMLKEGATVIDVGVNRVQDPGSEKGYKIVGDVDFRSALDVVSAITPVPGGVGPMTIAMLMSNTVKASRSMLNSDVS